MSGVLHGVAAVAYSSAVPYLLTGTTYSQSSVYPDNNAATYTYMNNGNANGSANNAQTGTDAGTSGGEWIKASLGSQKYVDHIVIGYDYLTNLPGGWGVTYTNDAIIQGSNDNSTWEDISVVPKYNTTGSSDGLVEIPIQGNWSYIRLYGDAPGRTPYVALLEFQVWVI